MNQNNKVTVKPVAFKRTPDPSKLTADAPKPNKNWVYPVITVVLAVAIIVWFMNWRENPFGEATIVYEPPSPGTIDDRNSNETQSTEPELTTPFHDLELQRAKESSKEILKQFGEYQDYVETNKLGLSIPKQVAIYSELIDHMNEADVIFAEGRYDDALDIYAATVGELGSYIDSLDRIFEHSTAAGIQALNERDQDQAQRHFQEALAIKPDDEATQEWLDRTALLPELNRLIRESDRAVLRQDYELAKKLLIDANKINFETPDIADRLAEIDVKIARESHSRRLGQAYALLNQGDLDRAATEFDALRKENPNDDAVATGFAEAKRLQTTARLKELRERIEEQEKQRNFAQAVALYNEVLEINPDLQFAKEGKRIQEQLMTSHTSMDFILNDPHRLSLNSEFEIAKEQLARAEVVVEHDPELKEKVARVEQILEQVQQEVPLVLISDNTMEIRLTNIGNLEPFDRLELSVRPGRYIVQGSRFGCRDIRKTVIVKPDMDPITIVCEDPI